MTGVYTRFASGVLLPLHERAKGHASVARRAELERSQWLKPEEIQALQATRLRDFLQRAGATVPFYADRFKAAGFDPRAVRSAADLAAFIAACGHEPHMVDLDAAAPRDDRRHDTSDDRGGAS